MRLDHFRRRERSILTARIGGYPVTVQSGDEKKPIAYLVRNYLAPRDDFSLIVEENKSALGNSSVRVNYTDICLDEPRGCFTEQAIQLLEKVARVLCLFPIEIVDLCSRSEVWWNGHWRPAKDILADDLGQRQIVFASVPMTFEWSTDCYDPKIVLVFQGNLVITDKGFELNIDKATEKEAGMEPTDEWYVVEVMTDKEEQIVNRLSKTPGGLSIFIAMTTTTPRLPARNLEWKSYTEIRGQNVIRWILVACLDCGIVFPHTALAEHGLTPNGELIVV